MADLIGSDDAMVRGGVILIALALAAPSLAAAETMSFGDAAAMLANACATEIGANCRGVSFDANRLKECLSRNTDVLSPQCATDYLKSLDAIQKRIAARITVATSSRWPMKVTRSETRNSAASA